MAASTPLQGKTKAPAKKTPTMAAGKGKGKPNGNIMSFFKRAESSGASITDLREEDEQLFLDDGGVQGDAKMPLQTPTPPREESSIDDWPKDVEMEMETVDTPLSRYNENAMPSKRRRTDDDQRQSPPIELTKPAPIRGPFVDDSDSEDEQATPPTVFLHRAMGPEEGCELAARNTTPKNERQPSEKESIDLAVPSLKREMTSVGEVNEFDGIDNFIDDEFPEEGEEYLERRWMEEQAEFEEGLEDEGQAMEDDTKDMELQDLRDTTSAMPQVVESSSCPICGGNIAGLNEQV